MFFLMHSLLISHIDVPRAIHPFPRGNVDVIIYIAILVELSHIYLYIYVRLLTS